MRASKSILAAILIAVMAAAIPFEADVSLAKRKTPPSKVYGLKLVKAGKKSITIKWRKARRAKKYIVYRSRGSKGRFVKRAVTSRTRFTDYRVNQGTVYRYYVRGYNGKQGKRSRIIKASALRYVVKRWNIGGDGYNAYDYKKQAWSTVKAVLYSDGLLKITGKGDFADFPAGNPWSVDKNSKTGKPYKKQIRSVYISKSVKPKYMGFMFSGCTNLRSINRIPNTAEDLTSTFEGCRNLTIAPAIPSKADYMHKTFAGCKSLRNAPAIPKKVTTISYAFEGCRLIKTPPELPKELTDIEGAFKNCKSLRKAPAIPKKVKSISHAFEGCRLIKSPPKLPAEVENMIGAFKNCISLTKAPEIPRRVKWASEAFAGCKSLRTASTIKRYNDIMNAVGMYKGCVNLRGDMWILGGFRNDAEFEDIFMNTATARGAYLRLRCKVGVDEDMMGVGRTIDRLLGSKPKGSKITEKPYFVKKTPVLKTWKIGGNGVTKYNHDTQGASNVIATLHEDGLLKIEGKGNTALFNDFDTEGNTPWGEEKINDTYYDKLIKYVYIKRSVGATNINAWFADCEELKKINRLPKTAKKMRKTFLNCKNLGTSPVIPGGVSIMNQTFMKSGLQKGPALPEGVVNLDQAFYNCNSLREAPLIPRAAEDLNSIFENCKNLRTGADIREGNNIKDANEMYDDCKNLTGKIYIHGAIKEGVDVDYFFDGAATAPGASLKVMYSSSASDAVKATVDRIMKTKSETSNIVKEMY